MFATIIKKLTGFDIGTVFIVLMFGLIAIIAIPNATRIYNLFGGETKDQIREQRDAARNTAEIAIQTNDLNLKDTRILESTIKNSEDVIIKKIEKDGKIDKAVADIKEKKKKTEKAVEESDISDSAKLDKNSEIQISSVWDAYCSLNSSPSCPSNTSF